MTTKKMTKKELFTKVLTFAEVQADPEIVSGLEHELELLERKNSADRKKTGNALENITLKEEVVDILSAESERLFTATEIQKAMKGDYSNQRVSGLLRSLKNEGRVTKIEEKRRSYFKIA